MTNPETKTLSQHILLFETAVRNRAFVEAQTHLVEALLILEQSAETFGGSLTGCSIRAEQEATRFCSAVTALFLDKEFKLSAELFLRFSRLKRAISQAFEVSGYRGTGHFVSMMGEANDQGGRRLMEYETLKLLTVLSVNNMTQELVQLLLKQDPKVGLQLVSAFLSEQVTYTATAEQARQAIFDHAGRWVNVEFTPAMIRNLGPAYMGCSYAEAANKHDIKKTINEVIVRWLRHNNVEDTPLPSPRLADKKRPTVLVLAELYNPKHAMHRCYGPSIATLKDQFETVLMTIDGKPDPQLHDMFDKVDGMVFDYDNPEPYLEHIRSYRPDIVYFPSVGMRFLSILASNIRFAPIQIFTPGHPATTHSAAMDYVILMDKDLGNHECFSERILLRKYKPYFEMRDDAAQVKPDIRRDPETVRLAVPAWARKITPHFLRTCHQIQQRSSRPVEFHFFPNTIGALYQGFRRRIEGVLPAKIYPRTSYNRYIENLNSCDIYLSTFPFGSTNGIVDAAIQGIPVVNMIGGEPHARFDANMLDALEQPDWLTATDAESYISAVLRLIENPDERIEISQGLLESNPADRLLVDDADSMQDFSALFRQVYDKHEAIVASGQKVWSLEDMERVPLGDKGA